MSIATTRHTGARRSIRRAGLVAALVLCLLANIAVQQVPGLVPMLALQTITMAGAVALVVLLVRSRRSAR